MRSVRAKGREREGGGGERETEKEKITKILLTGGFSCLTQSIYH